MPTLDWIGKAAVVNHHHEVPYRMLHDRPELSVGEPGSGNLLVEGDNLNALKALLPYYAGQVRCIYIDPPYNTGNESWVYSDSVSSPEMKRWLNAAVGGEAEDLSRHDKWLCMMYPRLTLLREFLREDGAIFVSIDDNEVGNLRALMDEVFGARSFIASIVWQKRTSPDIRTSLGPAHDYVVVYGGLRSRDRFNPVPYADERVAAYKNPDADPRGPWASVDITGQTGHATPSQYYEIASPAGLVLRPPAGLCWAMAEATVLQLIADNRMWFGKDGRGRPRVKRFLSEATGSTPWTWWPHAEVGHNQEATKELNAVLGVPGGFDTPKPSRLIKRILQIATDPDSLILDSFAGSGTTGHAMLQLNKEDGGSRRFILAEMETHIAQDITRERLRRVIEGYGHPGKEVDGLGGGFRYCQLGEPLFNEQGQLSEAVTFTDLARHIYFTESGDPLIGLLEDGSSLIGRAKGVEYHLLWNGFRGGSLLNSEVVRGMGRRACPRIIYPDYCRLTSSDLKRREITFKQIPYALKIA